MVKAAHIAVALAMMGAACVASSKVAFIITDQAGAGRPLTKVEPLTLPDFYSFADVWIDFTNTPGASSGVYSNMCPPARWDFNGSQSTSGYRPSISDGIALFDGSDDFIQIGSTSDLDFDTNDYTIGVWVKRTFTSGTYGLFQDMQENPSQLGIQTMWASTGWTYYEYYPSTHRSVLANGITTNWHLLVYTRTSSGLTGYIDGVQTGSKSGSKVDVTSSTAFTLGGKPPIGSYPYKGYMAAFFICNGYAASSNSIYKYYTDWQSQIKGRGP